MKLTPDNLVRLIALIDQGRLNRNTAAKVFRAIFPDNADVEEYVKAHGLEQVNDPGLVDRTAEAVFAAQAAAVADYRAGNRKVFGFLVGQVMKELKGRADPKTVNETVQKKLKIQD